MEDSVRDKVKKLFEMDYEDISKYLEVEKKEYLEKRIDEVLKNQARAYSRAITYWITT